MIRSILAVAAGLFLVIATNVLTGSLQIPPVIILAIRLIGLVAAGYVAAFISKRAPITHAFAVAAICFIISILSALVKSKYQDWPMWISGNFAATIYATWGGLFRKWQISKSWRKSNKTEKSSLPRSVLAIVIGFSVYMFYGVLSDAFWQPPSWANQVPALILFGVAATNLVAGYLTALISKREQIAHIFAMAGLCMIVPVVIRMFTGVNCDWGRWIVGALTMIICMTWSGLFRILQLQKRIDSAPPEIFTSTSPAPP
jgi:hypothetical protein